jgi:transcriptional regulator with XRE-family HTH domain
MSPTSYRDVLRTNLALERNRRGMTQDALASELRQHGLSWTQATVAAIEAGQRAVSAEEEKVLISVLGVPLKDLLRTNAKQVEMAGVRVSPKALRDLAHGQPVQLLPVAPADTPVRPDFAYPGGVAEMKVASKLGVPREVILDTCVRLWGRTLTEERELRSEEAGGLTSAQKGRVTRVLILEIESALGRRRTSKARLSR